MERKIRLVQLNHTYFTETKNNYQYNIRLHVMYSVDTAGQDITARNKLHLFEMNFLIVESGKC